MVDLGLVLINNPSVLYLPRRKSFADYRTPLNLFLRVGFDPCENRSAIVTFGRRWVDPVGSTRLSNVYTKFATRYSIEVPKVYRLDHGDKLQDSVRSILDDLKMTLPAVLDSLNRSDLIQIENEKHGAARINRKRGWLERCTVSEYLEP